ncbi:MULTISPECIES: TOBE domain-containing protein [unclassified Guyparkeria]|uniref:TOBE domain-containing protein n=1 Tax=unclassified Guyparkeria TaxID=2626246 RepID=UPI00082456D9|nr:MULTISPECIES: TOBE domain-containing protein [unclassified Guyparkeria]
MSIYSEKHNASFTGSLGLKLGAGEVSDRRLRLLAALEQTGSISGAARSIGMTYKAAWDAVDAINNLAERPLVATRHGGSRGGGAELTEEGRRLLSAWRRLEAMQRELLELFDRNELGEDLDQLRRIRMKTSARNALAGRVKTVTPGAVNSEVVVTLAGGDELVAVITRHSAEEMALAEDRPVHALIKSSFVILSDAGSRTSARNHLCGSVERIETGAVNSEVVVALPGGARITAVVTNASIEILGLREGGETCAQIKASHVILGVDD